MEPLFPEWSNAAIRFAIAGLVALLLGLPLALMVYVRTPYNLGTLYVVDQPVEFDHRHHVRDAGIDCLYCHYTADRSPFAGIPPTALCMGCHSQVWNDTIMLEPVRRSFFSGQSIAWNRVHDLPDFVYFNHSIHVTRGIGCESCHGRIDEMPRVYQAKPLNMGWCVDCHRDPLPQLRPPEAITAMGWPRARPEVAAQLAARYGTRSLTNCSTCHR